MNNINLLNCIIEAENNFIIFGRTAATGPVLPDQLRLRPIPFVLEYPI